MADTLSGVYRPAHDALAKALQTGGYSLHTLPGTQDIWVRDFMPIVRPGGSYVQFRYAPSYLRTRRERRTITATAPICAGLDIVAYQSELVVDGGNVVFVGKTAVVTDRVYRENPTVGAADLRRRLTEELQAEKLVVVPAHPDDFTGHADGMLLPVDERTVLVSAYRKEPAEFIALFRTKLAKAGLSLIELPYNPYGNQTYTDATGDYVNALRLPGLVLVPTFGMREDCGALRAYEGAFPAERVVGVRAVDVARQGGALHCITWTAC